MKLLLLRVGSKSAFKEEQHQVWNMSSQHKISVCFTGHYCRNVIHIKLLQYFQFLCVLLAHNFYESIICLV